MARATVLLADLECLFSFCVNLRPLYVPDLTQTGGPSPSSASFIARLNESGLVDENDSLGSVTKVEFGEGVAEVGLDGGFSKVELVGDHPICVPAGARSFLLTVSINLMPPARPVGSHSDSCTWPDGVRGDLPVGTIGRGHLLPQAAHSRTPQNVAPGHAS